MPLALRRLCGALAATATALALLPGAAHASGLAADASSCDDQHLDRVFMPFLDPANYTPAPGGTFERGAPGWALGRAKVVDGSEPYALTGSSDDRSLRIPGGASVTTPAMCVGLEHPTLRFMARNHGSVLAPLTVSVNFEDASGAVQTLPIGFVFGGSSWFPSAPLPVVANLLPVLPGEKTAVSFTLSTVPGTDGWQVDTIHVDPYSKN